ncbi:hypothetical protein [Eudoraea adriatica]|nr:hypothetical protein [Eudoraea adriatica]
MERKQLVVLPKVRNYYKELKIKTTTLCNIMDVLVVGEDCQPFLIFLHPP